MGGDGLDCDKLSREAADFHYDRCVKPLLRAFGPDLVKQTLAYYHSDSYESGWQNWTAKLPARFSLERRGYELAKYLPAITGRVVGDLATTEGFLWDFRRTIGDLYADNNYGRLAESAATRTASVSRRSPTAAPSSACQVSGRADHPMIEFWPCRPIRWRRRHRSWP